MKEFTEDEKMIAKNNDEKYKWIARDGNKRMYVFRTVEKTFVLTERGYTE